MNTYIAMGIILGFVYFTIALLNMEFKFIPSIYFLNTYDNFDNNDDLFLIILMNILISILIIFFWGLFIIPYTIIIISRIIKYYKIK